MTNAQKILSTLILTIAAAAQGCAVQAESAQDTQCLSHTEAELSKGTLACDQATAPDCGFDANAEPTTIAPTGNVDTVCHCIGGTYSCFGRVR